MDQKKIFCLPVLFFLITCQFSGNLSAQQGPYSQYLDHPWVDSVLSALSMEEKMAQSLWVLTGPDDGLPELLEYSRSIGNHGLGGLIITSEPNEQMKELADYSRSVSPLNPILALEGRWSGKFPDMASLAAIASDSLRYLAGAHLAAQFKEEGLSVFLTKEVDEAVSAGLRDNHIRIVDPGWIHGVRICEIANYMETKIPDDTLMQRARQALALKYWRNQQEEKKESSVEVRKRSGGTDQPAFIRVLYANSLTVLKNRGELIPIKDLEKTSIACLAVNQQNLTGFQKMAGLYSRTDNYFWNQGSENTELLAKKLAGYDLVLVGLYGKGISEETAALLSFLDKQTKLVVVRFGDAASLEENKTLAAQGATLDPAGLVLSYEQNPLTESLSAQLIFGGIGGKGRLAKNLGDLYPAGHGITTPGGLRLQYGFPENAGLCSRKLYQTIDSIVKRGLEAGAYPGCQVIIARKGTVIFHKAYGFHTYDHRIKVRKNDLYDLASVTKVSGPLSGLMLLEGMGKFSHQKDLGDYCQAMKGSDKADLALKDVLAHRAGLYPWIPYHENTLKKNGHKKKRFIRPDAGGKFTIQVADRIYLSNTYKGKIFKEIRKSELGEQTYVYSGLSFFLFPTLIEELSGQPYESFLAEQIYHRLGAWELLYHPRSSFPGSRIVPTEYDSVFRKQLVHGYVHDEGAALMGAYAGNAGLFASSNDLLKLIEMYRRMGSYGGDQIISSEVLREYTTYQFPELEIRRGLGFDKPLLGEKDGTPGDYPCPAASRASFGHSGFTGTFVWADPEYEISYVFLSNRVFPTRENSLLYDLDIRTSILQSVYDSIREP